jgi:enamine deaminase RidA (YjgF/YER057c/UK114 family)
MESIAVVPQAINPRGVAFLAGFASPSGDLTASGLAKVAREAGVPPANIVRVSCFYESPDQFVATRKAVADTFPSAEVAFVQSYAAATPAVECEAVGRLVDTVTATHYFNLPGTRPSPNFSRAALVGAPRIAFTGTQLALGDSQADMRALLEHAHVVVASLGGTLHDVVMAGNYWRTASARDALRPVRNDAYTATVPAATGIFITTLPSPTATVALELTVALPR